MEVVSPTIPSIWRAAAENIKFVRSIYLRCIQQCGAVCEMVCVCVCVSVSVAASEKTYVIEDLSPVAYTLWMTASTAVGEGPIGPRSKVKFFILRKSLVSQAPG